MTRPHCVRVPWQDQVVVDGGGRQQGWGWARARGPRRGRTEDQDASRRLSPQWRRRRTIRQPPWPSPGSPSATLNSIGSGDRAAGRLCSSFPQLGRVLGVAQNRLLKFDQVRSGLGVSSRRFPSRPRYVYSARDQRLKVRVQRRVGHLREQLLEVVATTAAGDR